MLADTQGSALPAGGVPGRGCSAGLSLGPGPGREFRQSSMDHRGQGAGGMSKPVVTQDLAYLFYFYF